MDTQGIKANGLELFRLDTAIAPLYPAASEENFIRPGTLKEMAAKRLASPFFVVAYLFDRVLIGRCVDGMFRFYNGQNVIEKDIIRLRAFNPKQELLVWRTGRDLKARLRVDDLTGTRNEAVVAHQMIFGTHRRKVAGGYTEISEERGTRLILPFDNLELSPDRRIAIKTYNYIGYTPAENPKADGDHPIGQATYVDSRFVCFTIEGKSLE